MQKKLTVSIDEEVLQEARKLALERNTSVSRMVRDYLAVWTGTISESARQAAVARFRELNRTSKAEVGTITWTRDDLYDRWPTSRVED